MRPTRIDFVNEEQDMAQQHIPTQAFVADNQEHGYEDIPIQSFVADNQEQGYEDQMNLPNVHSDECHPDDRPEVLFKEHENEDEKTQERLNYEDWVSICARGIDVGNEPDDCNGDFNLGSYYEQQNSQQNPLVNETSHDLVPIYDVTQEDETKWQQDFGQHLKEQERLEMINENIPEIELGEISSGMAFGSIEAYRDHLREYSVLKYRDFKVKKGDRTRHYAYCMNKVSQGCELKVNARLCPKQGTITVRECNIKHTCKNLNANHSRKCNEKFVAKYLLKTMDVGSPVDKAEHIDKKIISPKLNTDIAYWVSNDARKLVLAELKGTFESSYTKAPQLVTAATSLNPNSIGHFSWTKEGELNRFESVILAYDAQIKGFLNCCIKVIGLDGADLNGKLKGVMLCATGIDGQNGVFPICLMITTSETEENWFMVLKELRKRIPDMAGLTFISDRMKGILESVKRLFPLANHRYCLRLQKHTSLNIGRRPCKKWQG